jgi:hypothetical protein
MTEILKGRVAGKLAKVFARKILTRFDRQRGIGTPDAYDSPV